MNRAGRPGDDFEWPPASDEPGVYVVSLDTEDDDAEPPPGVWRRRAALAADPDPWRGLQEAATEVFAQRHGVTARPAPPPGYATRRESLHRLGLLLAGAAVVVSAASWGLYRLAGALPASTIARAEVPAQASGAAPAAVEARPPDVTVIATYPIEDRRAANDRADADAVQPVLAMAAAANDAAPGDGLDTPLAGHAPEPALLVDPATPLPDAPLAAADAGPSVSPLPVAAVSPPDAGRVAPGRDERIRRVLEQYEAAYDRRDVRTAAALVPSHDVRALSRAFDGLDRQDVSFNRCDIDAGDERGSAVCVGTVRYVPRVGRSVEREGRITWTFHLTRLGDDWRINRFSAR